MRNQRETKPIREVNLNIDCRWEAEPKTLGGFSSQEIISLIEAVARELGITPEQARKIQVHLDDHFGIRLDRKNIHRSSSFCMAKTNLFDRFKRCDVVFNRSREVFESEYLDFADDDFDLKPAETEAPGPLRAPLLTPREIITWTIVEELNHAQVYLRARTGKRFEQWQQKYSQYLVNRGQTPDGTYNFDLLEVTAGRHALRILEKKALQEGQKGRAMFFRNRYNASLRQRRAVIPQLSDELAEQICLPTGFTGQASFTR
jgi:hypothetical protein